MSNGIKPKVFHFVFTLATKQPYQRKPYWLMPAQIINNSARNETDRGVLLLI